MWDCSWWSTTENYVIYWFPHTYILQYSTVLFIILNLIRTNLCLLKYNSYNVCNFLQFSLKHKILKRQQQKRQRRKETGILAVHSHDNLKFILRGLYQDNNLVGVLLWQQSKPDEPAAYFCDAPQNKNTIQTLGTVDQQYVAAND